MTGDRRRTPPGVAAVVVARDDADRVARTVTAVFAVPGVRVVVVADDASRDDTCARAVEAGAHVVRAGHRRGRAAAVDAGAAEVALLDGARTDGGALALLLLDADLGASAGACAALTAPVLAGGADMTIAVAPPDEPPGGRTLVARLARRGIRSATGWTPTQPDIDARCLTREAFETARPLAPGAGLGAGLTIDLLTAGFRIREVACALQHRPGPHGLVRQARRVLRYTDVARALALRRVRRAAPLAVLRRLPGRSRPPR